MSSSFTEAQDLGCSLSVPLLSPDPRGSCWPKRWAKIPELRKRPGEAPRRTRGQRPQSVKDGVLLDTSRAKQVTLRVREGRI